MDPQLKQQIDSLKKQGHSVFSATIGGTKYIYRSFTRAEYRVIQDKINKKAAKARADFAENEPTLAQELERISESSQEDLVVQCLIDPVVTEEGISGIPGGVVPTLSELIMQAAGFGLDVVPEQL